MAFKKISTRLNHVVSNQQMFIFVFKMRQQIKNGYPPKSFHKNVFGGRLEVGKWKYLTKMQKYRSANILVKRESKKFSRNIYIFQKSSPREGVKNIKRHVLKKNKNNF